MNDDNMLTQEEINVLELLGKAASAFFGLETVHPSDSLDFTYAIHLAQNLVLARPGMRQYQARTGHVYMEQRPRPMDTSHGERSVRAKS